MVEYRWLYELSPEHRSAAAYLYVDAFKDSLVLMSTDLQAWFMWTAGALSPRRTLVALREGEVVASITYSEPGVRDAIDISIGQLIRAFGLQRGAIAYHVMRYEFAGPLLHETARLPYIELLAVAPSCQRQGLATATIRELTVRLGYPAYSIQVDDSNAAGRKLYDSMGFLEVGRIDEPWSAARKAGTMERVFMRLDLAANESEGAPRVQT